MAGRPRSAASQLPRPLRNLVRSRGLEMDGRVAQKTESPKELGNQSFGHIAFSLSQAGPRRGVCMGSLVDSPQAPLQSCWRFVLDFLKPEPSSFPTPKL